MWTADEFVISLCHAQQQGNNSVTLLNKVSSTLAKKFGGKTAQYSKVTTQSHHSDAHFVFPPF